MVSAATLGGNITRIAQIATSLFTFIPILLVYLIQVLPRIHFTDLFSFLLMSHNLEVRFDKHIISHNIAISHQFALDSAFIPFYNISVLRAGVVEWQTRRTQNPLVAIPCRFKSDHRHHTTIIRTKSS